MSFASLIILFLIIHLFLLFQIDFYNFLYKFSNGTKIKSVDEKFDTINTQDVISLYDIIKIDQLSFAIENTESLNYCYPNFHFKITNTINNNVSLLLIQFNNYGLLFKVG